MSINLRKCLGKNKANNQYNNNNQSCHNVLVENIIISNLFIHKPYESITTMQLIFCVTGTSRTCMFINLCNLWKKTSTIIKTPTTTNLLQRCIGRLVENTMTYSLFIHEKSNIYLSQPCNNVFSNRGGQGGGLNTATPQKKKINEHRIAARKADETPSPQQLFMTI